MYLVTYLGDLCNGLTLLIISKKRISSLDIWKLLIHSLFITLATLHFFSSRCDRCLFSAPFLYTTSGSNFFFCLYTHWYLMSTISFNICTLFLLYSRSRLMALLQKSRPKLTTSRTCEYDAILWQKGAITNTVELMISDTSFYLKYAPELTAQSIIHTV